ncbi:MAG: DUF1573 domain-containing protein [Bacteroidetes bacterium]|nr:DUF1573 domain-containing protein [Bacteroidota bacterium]
MNAKTLPLYFVLSALLVLSGCNAGGKNGKETIPADLVNNPNSASGTAGKGSLPVIQFEEVEHDFGRIIEGESVSYSFNFTNSGKSDLIIAEVSTSCGCTVPSYPKTPIRPGESGAVKVAFNSNGKRGYQSKNIIVASNTQPNTTVIRIKAQVVNPSTEK